MIRRQEKYSTRTCDDNVKGKKASMQLRGTTSKDDDVVDLSKNSPPMTMDSVVKEVSSKLKTVDIDAYNMFCCNARNKDDDDDATSSTVNESVSSSRLSTCQQSPVAPTAENRECGVSIRSSDLTSRALAEFPSLQKAAQFTSQQVAEELNGNGTRYCNDRNQNIGTEVVHGDDYPPGKPSVSSSRNDDYDDPPLSSQTEYARQQLYQSSRYRAQIAGYDDGDLIDEVQISRGLVGYEEGFGVHDYYYHEELPSTIVEEDDQEENYEDEKQDLTASYSEKRSSRKTEGGILSLEESTLDNNEQKIEGSGNTFTVCLYCQHGTCENEDCSASRFFI